LDSTDSFHISKGRVRAQGVGGPVPHLRAKGIGISINDTVRVDIKLEVGTETQVIEVSRTVHRSIRQWRAEGDVTLKPSRNTSADRGRCGALRGDFRHFGNPA